MEIINLVKSYLVSGIEFEIIILDYAGKIILQKSDWIL